MTPGRRMRYLPTATSLCYTGAKLKLDELFEDRTPYTSRSARPARISARSSGTLLPDRPLQIQELQAAPRQSSTPACSGEGHYARVGDRAPADRADWVARLVSPLTEGQAIDTLQSKGHAMPRELQDASSPGPYREAAEKTKHPPKPGFEGTMSTWRIPPGH